jgi:hypothetical protein
MLLFGVGTGLVLAMPVLLALYLVNIPGIMRHERDPNPLSVYPWLGFASFAIGGGLVLLDSLDPYLGMVAVMSIGGGVIAASMGVKQFKQSRTR